MGDALLALLRAAHGLTAAIWLGFALVGAWQPELLAASRGAGGWSARAVAQTSLWALVITGAVLMLDRLADPSGVSGLYVALLGFKLACVAAMGLLGLVSPAAEPPADGAGRRPWLTRARRQRLLLGLGLAAFVLGSLLTSAYEAAFRAG
ncbi:MAG TPA: hypothetical protein VFE37_04320 [Chloroflexota bacterium]|nr:hypothetical protein [Chloroflexota bacterium]